MYRNVQSQAYFEERERQRREQKAKEDAIRRRLRQLDLIQDLVYANVKHAVNVEPFRRRQRLQNPQRSHLNPVPMAGSGSNGPVEWFWKC